MVLNFPDQGDLIAGIFSPKQGIIIKMTKFILFNVDYYVNMDRHPGSVPNWNVDSASTLSITVVLYLMDRFLSGT